MSSEKVNLSSQTRTVFGRKLKRLRKQGIVPGNVFGKKIDSHSIQLSLQDFEKAYDTAGETGLINLKVDEDKSHPVLISAVQMHPVSGEVLHVDFHQVDLKEKVTAMVPIVITGEAPAVKEKGAVLLHPISEISIEALPTDIPSEFVLDISGLAEIGDSLTVADIKVDTTKVTLELSPEEPVVLIQEPKAEEPEEAPEAQEGDQEPAVEGAAAPEAGAQATSQE